MTSIVWPPYRHDLLLATAPQLGLTIPTLQQREPGSEDWREPRGQAGEGWSQKPSRLALAMLLQSDFLGAP